MADFKKGFAKFIERKPKKGKGGCCEVIGEGSIWKPSIYLNDKTAPQLPDLNIGDMVTIKAKVTGVNKREGDGKATWNYDLTCEEYLAEKGNDEK